MKGCRSLTPDELSKVKAALTLRDRALFILGLRTGFRIGELLSLNVSDVQYSDGTLKDSVHLQKRNTKGKVQSRIVPLHNEAVEILRLYLSVSKLSLESPLFVSSRGNRMERTVYSRNLKNAYTRASIRIEQLGTHSMRKTFAEAIYKASDGNLVLTQNALGHKSVSSTISYLQVDSKLVSNLIKNLK